MESVCKVLLVIAANCTFPPRQIGAATVCDLWPEVAAFKVKEKTISQSDRIGLYKVKNKCDKDLLFVLLDWDGPKAKAKAKAQMIPFPFECVCASQSVNLNNSCAAVQLPFFS